MRKQVTYRDVERPGDLEPRGDAAFGLTSNVEDGLPGDTGAVGELLPRQALPLPKSVKFSAESVEVRRRCGRLMVDGHVLWIGGGPDRGQSNKLD